GASELQRGLARQECYPGTRDGSTATVDSRDTLCAIPGEVPSRHSVQRCRTQWPPRPTLGPRRGGSFSATRPVSATSVQGIRSESERILDRFGHRTGGKARFEERSAAARYFERSDQDLGCGTRAADEKPLRALRSRSHLEGELLPRRRKRRTALLFSVAAYENTSSQFPRSRSVRRIDVRAASSTAKVADLPSRVEEQSWRLSMLFLMLGP